MKPFDTEPATFISALTSALGGTIAVLSLLLHWSSELTAGLTLALSGWAMVAGFVIRSRVTPVAQPTLTPAQAATLTVTPG